MRIVRMVAMAAALAISGASAVIGQNRDAAPVLAATREALGGEQNLTAVKTFVATGRTRQLRGNNLVPIEFEIACELPDKFVRKDEIPAQDTDLTVTGFRGDELIQFPPPGAARGGPGGRGGPPNPGPQRLTIIKQDFARLLLGIFATSFPTYPLTFTYAAEGEAPEGKADILDVAGPVNFSARLVVQRDTHLPVMLMWQAPAAAARGSGPPPANPAAVEYRLYYADYRTVNATKWPFRVRRAVGGATIEETTFDRITINTRIDPRKFEAPK